MWAILTRDRAVTKRLDNFLVTSGGKPATNIKFPQANQKRLSETKLWVAKLYVGTLKGKSKEIADVLERRNVGIACIQVARWKGRVQISLHIRRQKF